MYNPVTVDEAYNADGTLIWRYTGDATDPNQRAFVYLGNRLLAEYYGGSPSGTLFYHPDQIGSGITATDYTGNAVYEKLYYPFGQFWNGADPNQLMHHAFAQLPDWDPESNQYNTANRHYAPTGRWMSPDPGGAGADPNYPQSWNMYAYVGNNPTTNVDPDGLFSFVPNGCTAVPDNNAEGTSHVECPPPSSDMDLFGGILSDLQITRTVVSTISQGMQAVSDWFNQPRDPGCMATATGIGASVGGVAGGALGAVGGGAAGGAAGSLVPVVGTIGVGAAGAMSGAAAGAAEGALKGAAVGAGVGFIACAQGSGGGGGGGGNARANRQAEDAKQQAERETGKKFDKPLSRKFHDEVSGMGITDYHELVQIAKDVLNGYR